MPVSVSVVVVAHDIPRELPRTLCSLAPGYQRAIDSDEYEIVVIDNGSPRPLDSAVIAGFPGRLRTARIDPAPPSPARAANLGLALAEGDLVGLVVDGARLASPGLLATARKAARVADRAVIATVGFHLGPGRHEDAASSGYDQDAEDRLLASIGWPAQGYRLFEIASFAGSSGRGWFGPIGESSALFMRRSLWHELGGLDEEFALPGGGLVNHDLYRRACELPEVQLVMLLGEATFHQFHGGVATSRRLSWDDMHADYQAHRGVPYKPPANRPLYVGQLPAQTWTHIERSVRIAAERRARRQARADDEGSR